VPNCAQFATLLGHQDRSPCTRPSAIQLASPSRACSSLARSQLQVEPGPAVGWKSWLLPCLRRSLRSSGLALFFAATASLSLPRSSKNRIVDSQFGLDPLEPASNFCTAKDRQKTEGRAMSKMSPQEMENTPGPGAAVLSGDSFRQEFPLPEGPYREHCACFSDSSVSPACSLPVAPASSFP